MRPSLYKIFALHLGIDWKDSLEVEKGNIASASTISGVCASNGVKDMPSMLKLLTIIKE